MSVNMKSSLILNKTIALEDESVVVDDERFEYNGPGHSTPKRTKNSQIISQELQNRDYRSSPILLTQDTNNEVAWDWQSPKTRSRSKKRPDTSSTPKRTHTSHKKRHSNSPLIYKPYKKRIIKCEDIAKIDQWKNEFLALNAQIETVSSHETSKDNAESNNITDEIIFDDDFEIQENNQVIMIENSPPGVSTNMPESFAKVEKIAKENLDDLFDNSINDESMLKCSQEIEEKLSLGPIRKEPLKQLKRFGLSAINSKVSSKSVLFSPSTSTSKLRKHKSEPINKNLLNNQRTAGSDFKASDLFDDDFDIPDDSFDEIVLTLCTDNVELEKNVPKQSIPRSEIKNSNFNTKSNDIGVKNEGHWRKQECFQSKSSIKVTSVPPQKSSNQQQETSRSNDCVTSTQANTTNDKKFFRSRNRSDSSFDSSNRLNPNAVSSGVNWSNARSGSSGKGTVSTEIMDIKRTTSCMDRKESVMSKENSNCSINNFDRLRENDAGNNDGASASASRSQNLCTPEEIEKKRLEAKMRLEAKRRIQNFAKSINR